MSFFQKHKNHSPLKRLGQNFLVDPRARQRIIDACGFRKEEAALEIGPGLGHLTGCILPMVKHLIVLEKDKRFCFELHNRFAGLNITIHEADILTFDLTSLPAGLKVIGNLPYYISTPIIEKFIAHRTQFPKCYFTVQKEFADRLAAKENTKDYGSLSCFIQYFADVKILFKIPPTCFKPAPKVTSSFIAITFREPPLPAADERNLFKMIHAAFNQRRKRISNSLKNILGTNQERIFEQIGLTGGERAENISLQQYIKLANAAGSISANPRTNV